MDHSTRSVGFGAVMRLREYRALWIADTVSVLGDQLSRISVSLLVFYATHSAVTTAFVFALTFLPTLIGGALLSGLADRYSRKKVMIVTDLLRAGFFAVMALPGLSLITVSALLVVAVLLGSPFRAAQTATLPDVLEGDLYPVGLALRTISLQSAQLAGYALGGGIAAIASPRWGLFLDAVTFVLSASLIAVRVKDRPAPERPARTGSAMGEYWGGIGSGVALIARSPRLRILAGLALMSGFYVVPEGVAAPYAAVIGGGSVATGLLMAADPTGSAVGAWLLTRFVPRAMQERWMAALAVMPGIALMLCWLKPGLVTSIVIWAFAGATSSYQIPASVTFVRVLPDAQRGQALGLVSSGMLAAQGAGVLLAGLLAGIVGPRSAIGWGGAFGVVLTGVLAFRWSRLLMGTTPGVARISSAVHLQELTPRRPPR